MAGNDPKTTANRESIRAGAGFAGFWGEAERSLGAPSPGLLPPVSLSPGEVTLTRTAVELAGLGDVPFAEPCPLADGGTDAVHVVFGQDGVQEDAPGAGRA